MAKRTNKKTSRKTTGKKNKVKQNKPLAKSPAPPQPEPPTPSPDGPARLEQLSPEEILAFGPEDTNSLRRLAMECGVSPEGELEEIQQRLLELKLGAAPEPGGQPTVAEPESPSAPAPGAQSDDASDQDGPEIDNPGPADAENEDDDEENETPAVDSGEEQTNTNTKGTGRPALQTKCKYCNYPVRVKGTETEDHGDYTRVVRQMKCLNPRREHTYPVYGPAVQKPKPNTDAAPAVKMRRSAQAAIAK